MPNKTAWPKKLDRWSLKKASNGRKLAEVVAETIEQQIVRQDWPVGEVLGSEADLLGRFGVSRAVLREAIRVVENHGVARMRRGPNGGLVVTQPEVGSIAKAAALFLDFQHVSGAHLAEARLVVELAAVEHATRDLDEAGIARLKATLEREAEDLTADEDTLALSRGAHDLHALVASLSGNPALRLFVDVLIELTSSEHGRVEYQTAVRTAAERDEVAKSVHGAHRGIVEAMIAGDVGLAKHRMRRHLEAMERWLH